MAKVLILYYSAYGHVEQMALAVAEGVRSGGGTAGVRRVPETVPEEIAEASHFKLDQQAAVAEVAELADYDAIIVGVGTRYGRMAAQMAQFLDGAGGLWQQGALAGKVGAAFTSSASQHGGQEATLLSIITNLLHFGMVIVGLDYGFTPQMRIDAVLGGTPYGPSTVSGMKGERQPDEAELDAARYLGRRVALIAAKLAG